MSDFYIRRNDLLPTLQVVLSDAAGAVDLTGGTLLFNLRDPNAGSAKISGGSATITGAAGGSVTYSWVSGDTNLAGTYRAEFVLRSGGKDRTFPNDSYLRVVILEDLD